MKNKPTTRILGTLLSLGLLAGAATTQAANVSLKANDVSGASSFNGASQWNSSAAPIAGNDYFTAGWMMRTPPNTASSTFAGDSLTLNNPVSAGAGNGSVLEKSSLASGASRTLTINNLTNAAGALLRSGAANGSLVTIAGNHYTIAGTSSIWADQNIWIIASPLLGGDSVILTNRISNAANNIRFSGDNSGFKGSWLITSTVNNANCYVELQAANSWPGNPTAVNRGQITLGANAILLDTPGGTYNNANGGITLAANATINAPATTTIGTLITDNGLVRSLTKTGVGTLVLNASNYYSGGTIVSAGILRVGAANAIPSYNVTDNGTLDLNAISATIGALSGSGTVDTMAGGTPTLTIGANGASATFSGVIQNSAGTLSLSKVGAGTQTLSAGYGHSGATVVAGGRLSVVVGSVPVAAGDLIVTNGATLAVDTTSGISLPAQNAVVGPNGSLDMTLNSGAAGLSVAGNLTLQNNATNIFRLGSLTAIPSVAPINVAGSLSAPGTGIVLRIEGSGFQSGTFTLIDYTGTALTDLANFTLITPPNVSATLVNNTGNTSIDVNISFVTKNVSWYGATDANWDFTAYNWRTNGLDTFYQQYTNGSLIVGDGALFDDTLTNDLVNPQPTNINLTATFYPYPLVVDSTLPYSFSGVGSLAGTAALVKSNTGSLTLNTANSYTGGTYVYGGSVEIANDSALGASSASVTLSGSTLQINGSTTSGRDVTVPVSSFVGVGAGNTVRFNGAIGGAGGLSKTGNGTLELAASNSFAGSLFVKAGTLVLDSGVISSPGGVWDSIGQNGSDNATLTLKGTAAFRAAYDFNIGDVDAAVGTMNIQDSATFGVNNFFVASANNASSTAIGTVNQTGGSVVQSNSAVGMFSLGGRIAGAGGVGTYNLDGGTVTATAGIRVGGYGVGTFNQNGGTLLAVGGINVARMAGSAGVYNLNGGLFQTFNIASSTSSNSVFNCNGGTIMPTTNAAATTFFQGLSAAFVRNGGAIIDVTSLDLTIAQPLLHSTNTGDAAVDGGLTKKGSAKLTLSGVNTFTGSITNEAGSLVLNSASTYAGGLKVKGGTVTMTTATTLGGLTVVSNGAILSINQAGSATATLGNLTLSETSTTAGATLGLGITAANNAAVAFVNVGTLTLNGTNSISLAGGAKVGNIALIKYTGAIAGSGSCTNLILPQGATGFISNYVAGSTIYAVITSTGPGIVWSGAGNGLWDINTATNWLLGVIPTTYRQVIIPGDAVTFNDAGNGSVTVNTTVGPASLTISNTAMSYTFGGNGTITGPTGLQKFGAGTAVLNLTNSSYTGDTIVSNGTVQLGSATALSSAANLMLGASGTLQVAGFSPTVGELTGNGVIDNNSGSDMILTVGGSAGGTWNGTIQDHGGGAVALTKNGAGTWVVGGMNRLANGSAFSVQTVFNAGTTILTNSGSILVPYEQVWIANVAGSTGTVVVAGGTLAVSNNILVVGNIAGAEGNLLVNSGTVLHGGGANNAFGNPNNIVVGGAGGTGTLTVNGGQVLNTQGLWLGQNATGSGTLRLNGGLVQASVVQGNNTPATSIAYFNGGTLQAVTNSADFIQSTAYVQSAGLVLDDGGYAINVASQALQEDTASTGGGLIKKGAGTVYLDAYNTYTGTTVVSNGTLAGIGYISGPVLVTPTGNIGGGNETSMGALNLNSVPLNLQGKATLRVSKTGGSLSYDQIISISTVNYGGTLVITNTTTDMTPLAAGDTFQLFVAGSYTGNFASIVGSPGTGLAYQFDPATGILSVVAGYPPEPPPITFGISGGSLSLSWPPAYLGYFVQAQTNSLNVGIVTNESSWHAITGSGSATSLSIPINPANPTVFYRLHKPL